MENISQLRKPALYESMSMKCENYSLVMDRDVPRILNLQVLGVDSSP